MYYRVATFGVDGTSFLLTLSGLFKSVPQGNIRSPLLWRHYYFYFRLSFCRPTSLKQKRINA
ncbi:hypothetical protein SAMN04488056_1173 [Cohaesibacter marisflavi]|uniref:Uncharacterized protein n=1 Tax=Cohaesibacter marisflavi TaxID=655353 RepID=A0A1I5LHW0_9HYPH|nr:hypothetical protein SAMN04488056_1173 [Cohaesibacter marisflavi]